MQLSKPRPIPHGRLVRAGRLIVCLTSSVLAAACQQAVQAPAPPPPAVTVVSSELRNVTVSHHFTGTTTALESVEIRARIQGTLDEINFVPSTIVHAGQQLFLIEPAPYEAQLERARANRASAEAALRRAESDLERLEVAVRTNAVSQQEVTRARAERDQASAALLETEAAVRSAEIQLSYTRVVSPIRGLVSRNLVDRGNLVGVGGATLLATVRRIDSIYAYFDLSERLVVQFLASRGGERPRPGDADLQPAFLSIEGSEREFAGMVDNVDNTVDPETGTIRVRAVFANEDGLLMPGLFARVRVPGDVLQGAVVIDERAVATDLAGTYVLVVDADNMVEQRSVTLGPSPEPGSVVVSEGLDGGERIIVEGLLKARPGLPVDPQPASEG